MEKKIATQTSENKEWVFTPVNKVNLVHEEKDYVIISLKSGYTAIINRCFIRKKETEDYIYVSLPRDYKINVRQSEYNKEERKTNVLRTLEISVWDFNKYCRLNNKAIEEQKNGVVETHLDDDKLPF